jgi:Cu-Zn family superoxide dismutase
MTRTPILALALTALALPALAQENQPAPEGEETRPTNQTSQQTTEGMTEAQAAQDADQPENATGADGQGGTGGLVSADGTQLGNVSVEATASGHALVLINAEGFQEGVYAVHLHQVGACEGPAFETAGAHIGGTDEHGVMTDTGPHHGDLPNAHVGPDSQLAMEAFAIALSMDEVFDEDGSALIVHANPDDYTTQPSGNAGDRIACAVIEVAPGTTGDETVDSDEAEPAPATDAAEPTEGETESNGG